MGLWAKIKGIWDDDEWAKFIIRHEMEGQPMVFEEKEYYVIHSVPNGLIVSESKDDFSPLFLISYKSLRNRGVL
jgi:hypothetical protein